MVEMKQKMAKAEKKIRKSFLSKTRTLDPKKKKGKKNSSKSERKRGPELPSSLRKELNRPNPNPRSPDAGSNSDSDSDAAEPERPADLYEYSEPLPQEESKKNRRFDPVDNYEFELPEDFKDENIPSDDDEEELPSDDDDDGSDRHLRMLEGVTGMPGEAFEGKKRKNVVFSDELIVNYPEITIADLLDDYPGLPGYSKLRKQMLPEHQSVPLQAPLPTVEQQRIERKVTYEKSKKNITKWEPLVKRNRELPTLYFQEDVDLGFSTVGAIVSEFEPRTEFEKKMAMLVRDPEITEAHWKDGAKLLELNKIPVEDVRDRHNRLAKMRSLLFRHEMKAKHIKKIKSKTYHRILKKEKLKTASAEMQMDPEAAKEYAMKQEFKRAEERLTLKHKNSSKWARRIMERGLSVQDEGTQRAISEQLHQHALLTRKMNSMRDSDNSGTDDSSDDDEELSHATKTGGVSMILNRAKEKTIEVIEEEDEIPKSGVLALPFMERGLRKQKEAAYEEARLAIQEFNSSLRQLEDGNEAECPTSDKTSGRKVFGADREKSKKSHSRTKSENIGNNSDTEDELQDKEHEDVIHEAVPLEDVNIRWALQDESQMGQEPIYKSFEDIVKNPGPKTTHEVAIFVSDSWKKIKGENAADGRARETTAAGNPVLPRCDLKGTEQNSDSESDEDMVDGVLSSGAKLDYELPSQADLIHRAFAADDVEAEFEKDKMDVLNEENPEPEKQLPLPGWGEWTHIQQKKGTPSWMLDEQEKAKRKREEALHKRKDAQLKHVIISEKIDRKAEKLHAKTLPFPYTSKEVYEQSIRMPIGPEYNPAISVGALNRPAVVKKAGVIIKPIKYEDVDPYEREDEPKRSRQKQKTKATKSAGGKTVKKASGEKRS